MFTAYGAKQSGQEDFLLNMATLLRRAEAGDKSAQFLCGMGYHRGTFGFSVNIAEANKWLAQVRKEFGSGAEGAAEGYCYEHCLGGIKEQNIEDAMGAYGLNEKYLPAAFLSTSIWHSHPLGQGTNLTLAEKKLMSCVERGFTPAVAFLGMRYLTDGWCVKPDVQEGIKLLKEAAQHGDAGAAFELGQVYQQGLHGVPVNAAEARNYYRMAAAQDYPGADGAFKQMKKSSTCALL